MPNPTTAFGLDAVRHLHAREVVHNEFTIADAYGTSLFMGDPVVRTGTGRNIQIATAGSSGVITGVFNGCRYVDSNGDTKFSKHWPASTVIKPGSVTIALVFDDPDVVYRIKTATLAAADVGLLTDLVTGTGNAQTGLGAYTSAGLAGSENQLKILRLSDMVHSGGVVNAYGADAVADVLIANHEYRSDVAEI